MSTVNHKEYGTWGTFGVRSLEFMVRQGFEKVCFWMKMLFHIQMETVARWTAEKRNN